ncbi:MAG: ABC-F family ATP-binding cassette domain-containing protein, partial [bacterium]|nr:ABC-F family ATP-binding cassette domain-containing protein [bacterium]
MLQIRNLNYSIGDRQLLSGIDWVIRPGKRTALIGPNGAGKTTLLRILNNEIECPAGSISKPKIYRIGYLPQEEVALEGHSILQTVLDGQEEIKLLEKQIAQLHEALDADEVPDNMLNRLGDLEHQYEVLDGYHIESTAKSILSGLGFKESDLTRPLTEFSGGWRMRVYLAMLLVRKPDLLLMDEPTNHLDIPSIEWLEQYLLSFKGSMVLVSHDRFFIDRLAHEIVELDRGKLAFYSGNYHFFEKEKTLREALLQKQYKEQQLEISKQEKFINRFRYKSTKAAQVQSRIKLLDKMELITVAPPPPFLNFDLKVETSSYKDVLAIEDMSFKYDADWVLEKVNLNLYRGDKVSLVGVNGAGKTTLTRLIVEQLLPQLGSVKMGERVTVGYYAQHQVDTLNLEATAYEEIASTIATCHVPRIRDV